MKQFNNKMKRIMELNKKEEDDFLMNDRFKVVKGKGKEEKEGDTNEKN
jgi:hypothetical protein